MKRLFIAVAVATLPFFSASADDEATRLAIENAQAEVAVLEASGITREQNPTAWAKADAIAALVAQLPTPPTLAERVASAKESMESNPDANLRAAIRVLNEANVDSWSFGATALTESEVEAREELSALIDAQNEVERANTLELKRAALDAIVNPPSEDGE